MAHSRWTVTLEDGQHSVEAAVRGSTITLLVDGVARQVFKKPLVDVGSDYPFPLGPHEAILHSRTNGVTYKYDLSINGHSVSTNQPIVLIGATPPWTWVFVVACFLIPVSTLGGLAPSMLGSCGGMGCYMIAKKSDLSVAARVAGCLAITVVCWLLLFGLVILLGRNSMLR